MAGEKNDLPVGSQISIHVLYTLKPYTLFLLKLDYTRFDI